MKKGVNALPLILSVLVLLGCVSVLVFDNSLGYTFTTIAGGLGALVLLIAVPLAWVYLADWRDDKRTGRSESERIDAYLKRVKQDRENNDI